MARDLIPTQRPGQAGAQLATVAGDDTDGHMLDGGGSTLLIVENGTGAVEVTVQAAETRSGLDVADLVVTVPADETWVLGPFRSTTFDRPAGGDDPGTVYVDLDDATGVNLSAVGY